MNNTNNLNNPSNISNFTNKLTNNALWLVGLVFALHVLIVWPGFFNPDSQAQYEMAIAGLYNDHHPAIMSLVWRYLNYIIPGRGIMFVLHLGFFYGAIFYCVKATKNFSVKKSSNDPNSLFAGSLLFLLIPFVPQIFFYINTVCKDVGYAASFLLVVAYLSYALSNRCLVVSENNNNNKVTKCLFWKTCLKTLGLLIVLWYGTAIKFQAKYIAPIVIFWIAYMLLDYKLTKKLLVLFSALLIGFYGSLFGVNYLLSAKIEQNYSWQYVKMYDLAAISLEINQDLLPQVIKKDNYNMQALRRQFNGRVVFNFDNNNIIKMQYLHKLNLFNHHCVDSLAFNEDAILQKGKTAADRKLLYIAWLKAIAKYPGVYLKHRGINLLNLLIYPSGLKYINDFCYNPILCFLSSLGLWVIMPNLIPAILSLGYLTFGIKVWSRMRQRNCFAIPLVFCNSVGLAMLIVLLFCSMAASSRYCLISMCMVHMSHVFFYLTLKQYQQFRLTANSTAQISLDRAPATLV